MNNDADLIFIAVLQQMIGFLNMANLFNCDGGPYSYLVIPIKCLVVYKVHIQAHTMKWLINTERVSKHSVTIFGLRVVTPAGLEPG